MAIRYIINGYFRSGTTFMWDIVKRYTKYDIFYEPLHPLLPYFINNNVGIDNLHKKMLWNEYKNLPDDIKFSLCRKHPLINNPKGFSDNLLFEYFDIYHYLSDCILQLNRGHFFLDALAKRYNCKIIHIIRNPIDVYKSINFVCYIQKNLLDKLLFLFVLRFKNCDPFEINRDFFWIKSHIGKPRSIFSISSKWSLLFSRFQKFIIVWTMSNYYVIKSLKNSHNKLIVAYEELKYNPVTLFRDIEQFLDIQLTPDIREINIQNLFNYDKKWKKLLETSIERYELNQEYNAIIDYLYEMRGIIYNGQRS